MPDPLFFFMLLAGAFAGLLAGLLGIGGGLIFTPVLFYVFTSTAHPDAVAWSVASSLLCTGVAATSSAFRHFKSGHFWLKPSLMIGAMGFFGAYSGRLVTTSAWYDAKVFALVFSGILMATAISFLHRSSKSVTELPWEKERSLGWLHSFVIGGLGGTIATLSGAAGGVLVVPMLTLWRKMAFRKATAVSSAALAVISFLGVTQFAVLSPATEGVSPYHLGYVDIGLAFPMILGSLLGSWWGVKWSGKIKASWLQVLFALICVVMMSRILWDAFFK